MSGERVIERQLQDALHDVAVATVPDSRALPPLPDDEGSPHRRHRVAAVLAIAAAVVAIALVGVFARPGGGTPDPHHSPSLSVAAPSTSAPRPAKVVVGGFCDNFVPSGCAHPRYQPLWPYTSYTEAMRYRTGEPASSGWRHSATAVGRRYLRALGYPGISLKGGDPQPSKYVTGVIYSMVDRSHHDVGSLDLEQYGTTGAAAFEVVGVPRLERPGRFFGLDAPRRTARVTGSFTVRGRHAVPGSLVTIRSVSGTTQLGSARVRADPSGHWTAFVAAAEHGVTTVTAASQGTRGEPRRLVIQGFAHA